MMNRCFTWFPIGGQENPIYNINRFVLQEMGRIVEGCLTVKNQWELITGEHEGYSLQVTPWSVSVVPEVLEDQEVPFEEVRMVPELPTDTNVLLP